MSPHRIVRPRHQHTGLAGSFSEFPTSWMCLQSHVCLTGSCVLFLRGGVVLWGGRQAREDALLLLVACARSYGAAALKPHMARIWNGVRPIVTASISGSLGPEDIAEVCLVHTHLRL